MPEAAPAPAAPANGAAPAAATTTTPEQYFEVKVGGEMRKYTRAEAEKLLSKTGYADNVVRQAKEAIKAAAAAKEETEKEKQARLARAKENTDEWLKEHGIDPDAYARSKLEKKLAEHQMTPEQREAEAIKAENARLKKESEERAAKEKETQSQQAQKVLQQRMENQLAEAAERAGLSKDPDAFFAVYEAVKEWHRLKLPWDPDRIIETARENIDGGFKRLEQSVLKGLKGQQLEDRLGKAVVDELIRHRIERARNGTAPPARGATSSTAAPPRGNPSPSYISPQDLQAKYRGG